MASAAGAFYLFPIMKTSEYCLLAKFAFPAVGAASKLTASSKTKTSPSPHAASISTWSLSARAHLSGAGDVREPGALGVLDGAPRRLVEPLAEAHEHEETQHRVLERLRDVAGSVTRSPQLLHENAADPSARRPEPPDARRGCDAGGAKRARSRRE